MEKFGSSVFLYLIYRFQTNIHRTFSEPLLGGATMRDYGQYHPPWDQSTKGRPIANQRFDNSRVQFSRHPKSPSDPRRYLASQVEPPYRKSSGEG